MILILSNPYDITTGHVIKWLLFLNQKIIRINRGTEIEIDNIHLGPSEEIEFKYNGKKISSTDIHSYWYRRGEFKINKDIKVDTGDENSNLSINSSIEQELTIVENFLDHSFKQKKSIGSYDKRGMNKLSTLHIAKHCGLSIPDTIVTNNKKTLDSFLKKHKQIISKPIFETPMSKAGAYSMMVYTSEFTKVVLDKLDDEFFPSLFQKRLEKKYELRVFYLDGDCYTNAIFSQSDGQTSVDFRNYNAKRPNRRVAFNLPNEIKTKLQLLMPKVGLNCGSIDFIVTPKNEYVFLEINPIGQFGMTSFVGNFRLEKKVAEYLSTKE